MKFAYIANVRMPTEKAHGLQIMEMCSAFAENGAEVVLVVPRRFNAIKADPFEYYGIKRNFSILKLPCLDILPIFGGKFGFFIEEVSFYLSAEIYSWFHRFGALYIREAAAMSFFRDAYFEVHNMPRKVSPFFKKLIRGSPHLFPVTKALGDDLAAAGALREKMTIMPDGVDLRNFENLPSKEEARRRLNLPLDKKIVLYTGSFYLYSWKGVDVILQAAKQFEADTVFVLVGGDEKEIEGIEKKGISRNVILVAHRPHKEMPLYMKAADVLVLPNKTGSLHSEKYTSPLKLFEYMASGTPIVASRLPSICEILNDQNAFLVRPDSADALSAELQTVFSQPDKSNQKVLKALDDIKKYSWQSRAKLILAIISRSLSLH